MLLTPPLPVELNQSVQAEIQPGEKLVWAGQPRQGLQWGQSIVPMVFAVPWTWFAVHWLCGAWQHTMRQTHGHPGWAILFPLWGVPFVLVGLSMLTSPYWLMRQARRTVYVITDRRAILLLANPFRKPKVLSFAPSRLTSITKTHRRDGSGDLVFEQFTESYGSGSRTVRRGFLRIENVAEVEAIIGQTLLGRIDRF